MGGAGRDISEWGNWYRIAAVPVSDVENLRIELTLSKEPFDLVDIFFKFMPATTSDYRWFVREGRSTYALMSDVAYCRFGHRREKPALTGYGGVPVEAPYWDIFYQRWTP